MPSCHQVQKRASPPLDVGTAPLLRWPGGKRWLAPKIAHLIGGPCSKLIEPFAGGAAVSLALEPSFSVLSDLNSALVNAYTCVRDCVEPLIESISALPNDSSTYYKVRASNPTGDLDAAVRLLYLAKLSFNGIYRVNLKGKFNVPYSRKTWQSSCDAEHLRRCSIALQRTTLLCGDFETALDLVHCGDVVYLDPPYTVAHNNNGFIKYNEVLFRWEDQIRLAKLARKAVAKGALVIVSNADHASLDHLYSGFVKESVKRYSSVAASGAGRMHITESLFVGDGR